MIRDDDLPAQLHIRHLRRREIYPIIITGMDLDDYQLTFRKTESDGNMTFNLLSYGVTWVCCEKI